MQLDALQGDRATKIDDCPAIPLGPVERCALTVETKCYGPATLEAVVFTSPDGLVYDTEAALDGRELGPMIIPETPAVATEEDRPKPPARR